jgi:hypothetical protein
MKGTLMTSSSEKTANMLLAIILVLGIAMLAAQVLSV